MTETNQKQPELFNLKNVVVFIDGTNFCHSLFQTYNVNYLDILELSRKLCTSTRLLKQIRYYCSPFIQSINPQIYKEQQEYLAELSKTPTVKVINSGKYIKKQIVLKKDLMNL